MTLHRQALSAIVALALLLTTWVGAQGQSLFEKLVSPGEVVQSHAKTEAKCESCHSAFSKDSQNRLCLECHKPIASDIDTKAGFHGRRPDVRESECKSCHTDHKGRTANIVPFDPATFNHDMSDFRLVGAHATVSCGQCHAKGEAYRKAPQDCIGCHKKTDVHKGALGTACANCHDEQAWAKTKTFDHGKTRFALEGAHRDVACATCHVGERYKDLPRTCVSCHTIQDVHGGKYGQKCETCHAATKWTTIRFDHAKDTKFPLRGAHERVKCTTCHTGDLYKDKLGTACVACHKKNDPHKGELGTQCQTCHNETSWRKKVAFDHDVTAFPLIGLHAAAVCEDCHRTPAYRETPKACPACHEDKHHEGRLGSRCGQCHNPNGWALWRFDHAKATRFPLTGAHAATHCHACHKAKGVAPADTPKTCFGCHASDDAHRGSFGRACENCHVTTSFRDGLRR